MKIDIGKFRVREGGEVRLKAWPTLVEPIHESKKQYEKILATHLERLSARQSLLYADNRYALLPIFQAMDLHRNGIEPGIHSLRQAETSAKPPS